MNRPRYEEIVAELYLLDRLAPFDPRLIGTPPLDIDVRDSDIDVACSAPDLTAFVEHVDSAFADRYGYAVELLCSRGNDAVRVTFWHRGWEIELFCQRIPTADQWGVRHFDVERRLLALAPALRDRVRALKRRGIKTEPAFALVLGLPGDPFEAILALEAQDDAALREMAAAAVSRSP